MPRSVQSPRSPLPRGERGRKVEAREQHGEELARGHDGREDDGAKALDGEADDELHDRRGQAERKDPPHGFWEAHEEDDRANQLAARDSSCEAKRC
eukprot:230459-Chlamydomonas_euryale.AAC.1